MESEKQQLEDFIKEFKSIEELLKTILKDDRIDFSIRDEYFQKLFALQKNIIEKL